ncbi:MAG: hypothetical protein AAF914_03940 [Pseudomonadota bacterium]
MKTTGLLTALAACLMATGALAERRLCTIQDGADAPLNPPEVLFDYEPGSGSATVMHSWYDGPLTHELDVAETDRQWRMLATVQARGTNGTATLHIYMTYFPPRDSMTVTVRIGNNWGNMPSRADYSCAPA